jgi:hypothetical protein
MLKIGQKKQSSQLSITYKLDKTLVNLKLAVRISKLAANIPKPVIVLSIFSLLVFRKLSKPNTCFETENKFRYP